MRARYTIDGDSLLEAHLDATCARVRAGVESVLPSGRVQALVLGGGYGRGEGGVLRLTTGDLPYNDLEFYVFLAGNRLLNERRFGPVLRRLGDSLSGQAGVHVEFKVDSLPRLRASRPSMFSYDLVAGHKIVRGDRGAFAGCEHHLIAEHIPASEATRLLFNRCTGLLLARQLLTGNRLTAEDCDFIRRNVAKAKLAAGDAVLTMLGQYHWSCLERQRRVQVLATEERPASFSMVRQMHAQGVAFKLRPREGIEGGEDLRQEHELVAKVALELWLWVENRRLKTSFGTIEEYAASKRNKCPETSMWRNYLLNLKLFGVGAAFDPISRRYPRERLMSSLPLLLRGASGPPNGEWTRQVRRNLGTNACDWPGLCSAYSRLWPAFG